MIKEAMIFGFVFSVASCFVSCSSDRLAEFGTMTYNDCAKSRICNIRGQASVKYIDHVKMINLKTSSGDCVNISVPNESIMAFKNRDSLGTKTYTGHVFYLTKASDEVAVTINGRRIGVGECSDFIVFVE